MNERDIENMKIYMPRPYRARYFSPFGWLVVILGCVFAVLYGVAAVWYFYALTH